MTNMMERGNFLERRNLLCSFFSFWMPDFNDPLEEGKLAHLIVNIYGMEWAATMEELHIQVTTTCAAQSSSPKKKSTKEDKVIEHCRSLSDFKLELCGNNEYQQMC